MHIIVECPHCHERFQLDPSLRGKSMRCPVCRKIFDVSSAEVLPEPDEADFAPGPVETSAPPVMQTSGSVGDIIPLLSAEVAAPRPPEVSAPLPSPETVEASWAGAGPLPLEQLIDVPPPVRQPGAAVLLSAPPPTPSVEEDASWLGMPPTEEPVAVATAAPLPKGSTVADWSPDNWQAPPVRAAGVTAPPAPLVAAAPPPPANPPNWPLRILAALVLLGLGSLGAFALIIIVNTPRTEEQLRLKAEQDYRDERFAEASNRFHELEISSTSADKNQPYYHFMTGLSDVRDAAARAPEGAEDLIKVRESLSKFVENCKGDPQQEKYLEKHRDDVWNTYFKLAAVLEEWAKREATQRPPGDLRTARRLLGEARVALREADPFRPPDKLPAVEDLRRELDRGEAAVARHERRGEFVAGLKNLVRVTSPSQAVAALREQLAREGHALPELPNDPDVRQILSDALRKHRDFVTYTEAKAAPRAPVEDDPDRLTNLLMVPPVGEPMLRAPARAEVVFAVARGVLYALDAETGKPRWATRVGIDAAHLPVWLPRPDKEPALVLVVSADSGTVTAREALTGKPRWRHRPPSPCLGRPLLVDGRIYLPGYDGRIDELDLTGRLLGFYQVGQPLTTGGVHQPGTSLLYFPEDSYTVYVLDVAKKTCAGILYSKHPSGSLRCPPVVINGADGAGKGHLILCQADGVDAMKLHVFPLPITGPDAPPREPEIRLAGWASAPPYQDGETLAVVTDAGPLKLLGLRQKGNRDPELFPLFPQDVMLRGDSPGAAQIAHSDGYEFWVLAQGALHRLRKSFDRQTGPKLVELPPALEVGSPLHASQTDAEEQTLFVTALTPAGRSCQTTALDLRDGAVRWRRQLGLVPRAAPLGLGSRVLVQDQGGAMFLFDAGEVKKDGWIEAGQALTTPEPETALLRSLPAKGGKDAYVLSFRGTKLQLRRLAAGRQELEAARTFTLPAGLAGVPGVWEDHLVLPLANGILYRQPLGEEEGAAGQNWRVQQAEPGAAGYVVPVGKTDFLVTDGGLGLHYLDWPQGQTGSKKRSSVQLRRRIAAPPVLLPRAQDSELRVCVADADGTLTLLQGDKLNTVREWKLGGPVTAGPFVRGGEVGCVVEKRRLVWINPGREQHAWEYETTADLVGEPVLADGLLVVADQSGRVAALDPKTGREAGLPYVFRGSACPASAPLPFGEGRLFVSLSDGTAVVLPLRLLRQDLRDFPIIW